MRKIIPLGLILVLLFPTPSWSKESEIHSRDSIHEILNFINNLSKDFIFPVIQEQILPSFEHPILKHIPNSKNTWNEIRRLQTRLYQNGDYFVLSKQVRSGFSSDILLQLCNTHSHRCDNNYTNPQISFNPSQIRVLNIWGWLRTLQFYGSAISTVLGAKMAFGLAAEYGIGAIGYRLQSLIASGSGRSPQLLRALSYGDAGRAFSYFIRGLPFAAATPLDNNFAGGAFNQLDPFYLGKRSLIERALVQFSKASHQQEIWLIRDQAYRDVAQLIVPDLHKDLNRTP